MSCCLFENLSTQGPKLVIQTQKMLLQELLLELLHVFTIYLEKGGASHPLLIKSKVHAAAPAAAPGAARSVSEKLLTLKRLSKRQHAIRTVILLVKALVLHYPP